MFVNFLTIGFPEAVKPSNIEAAKTLFPLPLTLTRVKLLVKLPVVGLVVIAPATDDCQTFPSIQ